MSPDTVPLSAAEVVTRKDPRGRLLFHIGTDEMYFLSESAHLIFQLCDGTRTVRQIEDLIASGNPEWSGNDARTRVEDLLAELARRQIIELWS
jgi:Coenzyme PQQ synthesis protein D (PqqD)